MSAKTRIYVVKDNASGGVRLVKGYSPSQARSFVAQKTLSVEVAGTDIVYDLAKKGALVEDASAPETQDAFE